MDADELIAKALQTRVVVPAGLDHDELSDMCLRAAIKEAARLAYEDAARLIADNVECLDSRTHKLSLSPRGEGNRWALIYADDLRAKAAEMGK